MGVDCTKGLSPVPQEGPRHLSILPKCISVLVLLKHSPPPPLHMHDLAAVGFHLLPLPCQEKPLLWPWVTCGQTGGLYSSISFLNLEAGLVQPSMWGPPNILTSKLGLMEELLDGSGTGWMVESRDLQ